MTVMCIQCSLKALVAGQPPPYFEETIEEHMRRVHPDPTLTATERKLLEKQLMAQLSRKPNK